MFGGLINKNEIQKKVHGTTRTILAMNLLTLKGHAFRFQAVECPKIKAWRPKFELKNFVAIERFVLIIRLLDDEELSRS